MEMHQIRYFLALCECLNFTRAAENCNVSQPSLTRAIKSLEDELGGPLFHRERNNTHVTELGRTMRPYLEQVAAQTEQAKIRARDFAKLDNAPLKLGIMCTIGPTKLLDLMEQFRIQNPGVELHLQDASANVLKEKLVQGELDIAIFGHPDGIEERFHALKLFDERFVVAVAPGHRFTKFDAVRCRDLNGERYLSRANCEFGEYAGKILRDQGVQLVRPYRSERDDWIQMMALAGLGFSYIPEYAVTVTGLVTRPLIEPEFVRSINLVTVRGRPHAPAVGAFTRQAMRIKWS